MRDISENKETNKEELTQHTVENNNWGFGRKASGEIRESVDASKKLIRGHYLMFGNALLVFILGYCVFFIETQSVNILSVSLNDGREVSVVISEDTTVNNKLDALNKLNEIGCGELNLNEIKRVETYIGFDINRAGIKPKGDRTCTIEINNNDVSSVEYQAIQLNHYNLSLKEKVLSIEEGIDEMSNSNPITSTGLMLENHIERLKQQQENINAELISPEYGKHQIIENRTYIEEKVSSIAEEIIKNNYVKERWSIHQKYNEGVITERELEMIFAHIGSREQKEIENLKK